MQLDEVANSPPGLDALKCAISVVGLSKLAAEIGVDYQLIQGWQKPGRRYSVPAEYCVAIELATNGAVTRRDLRPEDWQKIWPELAAPTQSERVAQ